MRGDDASFSLNDSAGIFASFSGSYYAVVDLENVEGSVRVVRLGDRVCGLISSWSAENKPKQRHWRWCWSLASLNLMMGEVCDLAPVDERCFMGEIGDVFRAINF